MDIKRATFITSLPRYAPYPGIGLPEVAIAGKSNVGKSSMINCLCTRNKLAKVSGTPGKTRLLNIFRLNDDLHLVDLPGYGFARVPKAEQQRWAQMMEGYFAESVLLRHVLHLVDMRHEPTAEDKGMQEFLRATGLPCTVVATKADKLSRAQRARQVHMICRTLMVQPWEVVAFSSENGEGRDGVLGVFDRIVGEAGMLEEAQEG
ncbi:MAG: ribosome biogenesis GTP-binding protein YihA/YsxC [Oscillospiraceae bacterium]|jgi:GTP-binding protein|nr:ribosome biogenesis GTP-binding protein YihA/YsxC [Oscillospiraceae bacterium]